MQITIDIQSIMDWFFALHFGFRLLIIFCGYIAIGTIVGKILILASKYDKELEDMAPVLCVVWPIFSPFVFLACIFFLMAFIFKFLLGQNKE